MMNIGQAFSIWVITGSLNVYSFIIEVEFRHRIVMLIIAHVKAIFNDKFENFFAKNGSFLPIYFPTKNLAAYPRPRGII